MVLSHWANVVGRIDDLLHDVAWEVLFVGRILHHLLSFENCEARIFLSLVSLPHYNPYRASSLCFRRLIRLTVL